MQWIFSHVKSYIRHENQQNVFSYTMQITVHVTYLINQCFVLYLHIWTWLAVMFQDQNAFFFFACSLLILFVWLCSHLQSKVMACERCREVFSKDGPLRVPAVTQDNRDSDLDEEKDSLKAQLRELELELAQTKLQLVEAKCRIQVRI